MWTSIATIVGALFAALASSGIVQYIQNKHKTGAETRAIEESVIVKVRREGDKRSDILIAHAELNEYKFDMLMEEYMKLIDSIRGKDCTTGDVLVELRKRAYDIKYIDRIPGRQPPPQFPSSPQESLD